MKRQAKRIMVLTLAVIFILLGLAGLVLPLLQGWLFIFIGLLLFSMHSPRLRAWIDHHTVKYPRLHGVIERANSWVVKVFGVPEE